MNTLTKIFRSVGRRGFLLGLCLLPMSAIALWLYQAGPDTQAYLPSPQPDRIILTVTADPATSMAVTWRTDTSVQRAYAEIAEDDDGPEFDKKARRLEALTETYATNLGPAHTHSVTFQGLRPATAYVYRVGDGKRWSEWIPFRTAGERGAPLTLLYLGDAQNDIRSKWSRVIHRAYAAAPDASLIVHAGDLINNFDRDEQWGEWHAGGGMILRMTPSFPSPGNHEYGRGPSGERRITVNWRAQFTLPLNGPAGLEETCYYADIQGVRMISLNSVEKQQEQAQWLDALLSKNPNRWTIIVFHHPIYSTARGRDNKELRELWQPIFDKHAVDLVLQGHDHTYARTPLMTAREADKGKAGTVYVVSVSGTKMYALDPKSIFVRVAEDTQLFQVIRIQGDRLSFEAHTAGGALYDAFELRKRAGKPNELIERAPKTAPRVRKAA